MRQLLIFSFLFLTSCLFNNDDDMSPPDPIDPIDQLPPITMEGANTFGCLMNGEVWIPEVTSFSDKDIDAIYTIPSEIFQIHTRLNKDDIDQLLTIGIFDIASEGSFDIVYLDDILLDLKEARCMN